MSFKVSRYKDLAIISEEQNSEVLLFHPTLMDLAVIPKSNVDFNNLKSSAIEELNSWLEEKSVDSIYQKKHSRISSISINATQICNLKCLYCEAGGDGTYSDPQFKISISKTLPQLEWLMSKTPQGESFRINFIGGEPLLNADGIYALCEFATKQSKLHNFKLSFSIVTNGTICNDQILNLLSTFKFDVTISLDGPQKINDTIRPSKDGQSSTEKIISTISALVKIKENLNSLNLHGVFGEKNNALVEAYNFYSQLKVDSFEFAFDVASSSSEKANEEYIQGMTSIAQLAWNKNGEEELRKINFFNKIFRAIDNSEFKHNYCGMGKNFAVIDAKNNFYGCPWLVGKKEFSVGSESEFNMTAYSKEESLIELNNCSQCWARYLCGGGCMYINSSTTGNLHLKNKLFCNRTQNLIALAILYYKKAREISN